MPTISDLPAVVSLLSTDEAPFNQGGTTVRGSITQLATAAQPSIDHTLIQNVGSNTHSQIDTHIANTSNPHSVTKAQVGLGNVENIKVKLDATVAPGVNDDNTQGYSVGSRWIDITGDNEYVAVDVSTGAAKWIATTSVAVGTLTVTPGNNNSGARAPYASVAVATGGSGEFSFVVPDDFVSVLSCKIYGIAGATDTARDIDIIVNYAAETGEAYNANSASDTTTTYNTTVDQFLVLNVAPLLTGIAATDQVGVEIDHNAIAQTIYYTCLKLRYNRF